MISLAHFGTGHWWVWILYALPVAIVLAAIAWEAIRSRRAERAQANEPGHTTSSTSNAGRRLRGGP